MTESAAICLSKTVGTFTPRLNRLPARCRQVLSQLNLRSWHRLAIAVVGGSIVWLRMAMLVLPGPGILVLPVGLAILPTEFVWVRRGQPAPT